MMQINMRIFLLTITLFLTLGSSLKAETPSVMASQANRAFQSGDYARAAELWEGLKQLGFDNLNLHYNLAQAYWHLGDKGRSLASLTKARHFDRGHPKVSPGIEILQESLGLNNNGFVESLNFLPWYRLYLNRQQALWFFALASVVFFAYLFFKIFRPQSSNWLLLALAFVYGVSAFQFFAYLPLGSKALVVVKEAQLVQDPVASAPVLEKIKEGRPLKVLDTGANYWLVQSDTGQRGYVAKDSLGEI